jgi:putative DNA primase/helicase
MVMERKDFSLDDVADALQFLDESNRDLWIEMGMAIRAEFGDDGFAVWDRWSSGYGDYDARICKTTWRSFRKRGIGLGTLVKKAMDAGWTPDSLDDLTREELAKAAAARREKAAEQMARDEEKARQMQDAVAVASVKLLNMLLDDGKSRYLANKRVAAFGLKFVQQGVIIETDEDACTVRIITGADAIKAYFKNTPDEDSPISFKYLKPGAVVMPLVDYALMPWNVQIIFESGKKSFLKGGRKSGLFHLIAGEPESDSDVVAVVEGYATGASVRMASGWNVAVALDSGNIPKVAALMPELFPGKTYMIVADNDVETDGNPGVTKGLEAAALINAHLAVPEFKGAA